MRQKALLTGLFILFLAPVVWSVAPICVNSSFISNPFPADVNHNQYSPSISDGVIGWVEAESPNLKNNKGRVFLHFLGFDKLFGTADDFELELTKNAPAHISVNNVKLSGEYALLESINFDKNVYELSLCKVTDANCLSGSEKNIASASISGVGILGFDIAGDKVVWSDGTFVNLYDIQKSRVKKIIASSPLNPKVNENLVVWDSFVDLDSNAATADYRIFIYHIATETVSIGYQTNEFGYVSLFEDIGTLNGETSLLLNRNHDGYYYYEDNPSVISVENKSVKTHGPFTFWNKGSYYDYSMDDLTPWAYFEYDINHEYTFFDDGSGEITGLSLGKTIVGYDFSSRSPFRVASTTGAIRDIAGFGGNIVYIDTQFPDLTNSEYGIARVKLASCT